MNEAVLEWHLVDKQNSIGAYLTHCQNFRQEYGYNNILWWSFISNTGRSMVIITFCDGLLFQIQQISGFYLRTNNWVSQRLNVYGVSMLKVH